MDGGVLGRAELHVEEAGFFQMRPPGRFRVELGHSSKPWFRARASLKDHVFFTKLKRTGVTLCVHAMWVLEPFPCLVLRPERVLPARVSGSAAHAGVCARAAGEGLGAPAGPQTRALCVGRPAAVRAPEGPGVRVEGTAWGGRGCDLRAWAPGRGVQGHDFPSRRRVRGEGAGALNTKHRVD